MTYMYNYNYYLQLQPCLNSLFKYVKLNLIYTKIKHIQLVGKDKAANGFIKHIHCRHCVLKHVRQQYMRN